MSWLIAFAGFAALVVLHEFGHFAAAKAVGMRVERFALFFPPLILRYRRGETEYALGALPLGGYVKITGMTSEEEISEQDAHRAYCNQPVWKRIVVIAAGPLMNIVIAIAILWTLFTVAGTQLAEVVKVDRDSPAAGILQRGDLIVSADGRYVGRTEIADRIAKHRCPATSSDGCRATTPVAVTFRREGKLRSAAIPPAYDAKVRRMRLGLTYRGSNEREPHPVGDAATVTFTGIWQMTTAVFALPARILDSTKRKELSSAVGGYEATRQAVKSDTAQAFTIIALISLSLALFNLFPFLPLDGGHIFWAIAEKIRGKPIPVRVLERASVIGIALVLMLFTIGLTNDIERFQNGGFGQ